ncbi:MAG TPA: hypothetical protein VJR05_00900 [Acidimicrobiia bacterium]|nr:hypothetical protein [Acidimicrobiia bacterium]
MSRGTRKLLVTALAAVMVLTASAAVAAPTKATCAGVVGEVHGHHVFGDYVTGAGHDFDWPPRGQFNAAGGAVLPGGPGPGFHFPNAFAPGASFCNSQSSSPGFHLPG